MQTRTRFALLVLLACAGCATPPRESGKNEVIVMGMIHGGHRTHSAYGIDVVKRMLRAMQPDYVLAEIPPDRLAAATEQFRTTGTITEPRVRIFPEYTDAVFPLTREMDFEIVGCAAWTKTMADDRRRKLARFKVERPDEHRKVTAARAGIWSPRDPKRIHTKRYDRGVAKGMAPYNRLWNDALGAGGWDNINAAHFALIEKTLDAHRGEGKRFLITFGAWHKHWFLRELRKRSDIVLLDAGDFVE